MNVITITFSALKFIHVRANVTLMAVQFINVEGLFFLRKSIGPKNPLVSARIAYFVILRRSAKNMVLINLPK